MVQKSVFVMIYVGGDHDTTKRRLKKVCEIFSAQTFSIPESKLQFVRQMAKINTTLQQQKEIINITKNQVKLMLNEYLKNHFKVSCPTTRSHSNRTAAAPKSKSTSSSF